MGYVWWGGVARAVYGDGGPGGAQALGLMLRRFARKLPPSGLEVDSALTDRQRTQG